MIEGKLLDFLKDKSIIILGYGREGESTYKFIRKNFPDKKIEIVDENVKITELKPYLNDDKNIEFNLSSDYFRDIDKYDIVVKTPGISFKDYDISEFRDKIYSQLELLLEFIPCKTIGITGTKGKSTTSSLLYKVLKDQGLDTLLLGNIGEPYFNDLDKMSEDTILVLELSSHALEFVRKSPNISILLNIFQEHLDHHNKIDEYITAKFNIAKYQEKGDYFIYNATNEYMTEFINQKIIDEENIIKENDIAILGNISKEDKDKCKKIKEDIVNGKFKNYIHMIDHTIYLNNDILCDKKINTKLKGNHNINNMLFIFAVAKILNLDFKKVLKSFKEFEPLEHRLEFVDTINDITYYNDSISTIPEATIAAIKALKHVNTVIVGGTDRGISLDILYSFLKKNKKVENIICLPKTGEYIYEALKNSNKKLIMVKNVEEAVVEASKITKKGEICLLSPSSASYGFYKNFEERGKVFKESVKKLKK